MYPPGLVTALFITARKCEQSTCPLMDAWTHKMWSTQTIEYYLALKRSMASLVAWAVKSLPVMQEMWVWSLEKEMATHSRILAWEIPWTEEPGATVYRVAKRHDSND